VTGTFTVEIVGERKSSSWVRSHEDVFWPGGEQLDSTERWAADKLGKE